MTDLHGYFRFALHHKWEWRVAVSSLKLMAGHGFKAQGGAMYRGRLENDFSTWVGKGLISRQQADAMLKEYDGRESSFSVGRVLMMIAACLIGAALLLLIASNWEAIPRPVRAGLLVFAIWFFHGAAAWFFTRQHRALAEGALVIGTASFGAAMSLVAQMYHLSGDMLDMLRVWFLFTVLTTLAFRSGAAGYLCGFLAWGYFGTLIFDSPFAWRAGPGMLVPVMAVALVGLVHYTGAARLRHLAYMLMLAWLVWLLADNESVAGAMALAAAGAVCFLAAALPVSPLYAVARRAGAAPAFYAFVAFLIGIGVLHAEYDDPGGRLAVGIVTMAACVGAIAVSGRDNGAVRYLAYAVFALEVLYLASETIGSILGTSGFFLISGLVVALTAWIVITLEKRMSRREA